MNGTSVAVVLVTLNNPICKSCQSLLECNVRQCFVNKIGLLQSNITSGLFEVQIMVRHERERERERERDRDRDRDRDRHRERGFDVSLSGLK